MKAKFFVILKETVYTKCNLEFWFWKKCWFWCGKVCVTHLCPSYCISCNGMFSVLLIVLGQNVVEVSLVLLNNSCKWNAWHTFNITWAQQSFLSGDATEVEVFVLLGCHTALVPEQRRPQLHHGGSLKSDTECVNFYLK